MISIFFVMSAIIMTINFSNFYVIEKTTRKNLSTLLTEEEVYPYDSYTGEITYPPFDPNEEEDEPDDRFRPEAYFIVVFDEGGNAISANKHIVNWDIKTKCIPLAKRYLDSSANYGKHLNYRYKKAKEGNNTKIVVIDINIKRNEAFVYMWGSFVVGGVGYLLFLLLILGMSRIVLRVNEKAYQNQKEFITNASHELKTPLTIISTDIEIIEMDHGQSEWTKSIKDQVANLTLMTNQLVTSARLEEGNETSYPMEDFNLTEVVNESIEAFAASLKSKHLVLHTKVEKNINYNGNRYLITELLYIFFDNALKYCEEHGDVEVILKKNKNKIEISFGNTLQKNNNIEVDKLFDRFYRDPENKISGTGIGLSISKQIVELHKGKIQAVQEDGKIKFIVIL